MAGDASVALIYAGLAESSEAPVMSPPLGIHVLKSFLARHGIEARLYDSRLDTPGEVADHIAEHPPTLVGISFLSTAIGVAREYARAVRAAGPWPIVAGGPHASVLPDSLSDIADHVVVGEGELALLELVEALARGRSSDRIIESAATVDLATVGVPLIDEKYTTIMASRQYRSFYVQLTRGCPKRCAFCEVAADRPLGNPVVRTRPLDHVIAEIDRAVSDWGANYVVFADSIATIDPEAFATTVRYLNTVHPELSFQFNFYPHPRYVPEGVRAALAGATARRTGYCGFESGSEPILRRMRKSHRPAAAATACRLVAGTGTAVAANILLGVPEETREDYDATRRWIDVIQPDIANPNILHPLPGTEVHEWAARNLLLRYRGEEQFRIWSAAELRRDPSAGPLRGVDYGRVTDAAYYYREGTPAPGAGWPSWGADSSLGDAKR